MPAPLVGAAAVAAARLVAKKLAGKAAKKVVGKSVKKAAAAKKQAATRAETVRIAKNSVKVKPAAKPKPNKPNEAKMLYKVRDSGGRAYNKAIKEYDSMPEAGRFGSAAERQAAGIDAMAKAPVGRKTSIAAKKLNQAKALPKKSPAKRLKPMEDVPAGVSARFAATNARLAKEAAKKKKK